MSTAQVTIGRIQADGHASAHIKATGEDIYVPASVVLENALAVGETFSMELKYSHANGGARIATSIYRGRI
jgi:hypothetical protein